MNRILLLLNALSLAALVGLILQPESAATPEQGQATPSTISRLVEFGTTATSVPVPIPLSRSQPATDQRLVF